MTSAWPPGAGGGV